MQQDELVRQLDSFFSIEAFDEAEHWRSRMSEAEYRVLERFAVPEFLSGPWNGLTLDNTDQVERVYLVVFPAQPVLDTIIAREVADGAPGALIFAHHLTDYEESGRGPVAIPEVQLEELKEHRISYYTCHAPLDCNQEISTAKALANALGLREQELFAPYYGGMSAVHGLVGKPVSFQSFAARLAKVTDVERLRYDQVRHSGLAVNRVAVVPGNGGRPERLAEAAALGCDTYVTGHWWFFSEKNEAAEQQREQMRDLLPGVRMNLLGVSHYATEMVVMRDQMPGWFHDRGVDAEFVPQEDPWR